MQTVEELKMEESLNRKIRKKRRIRGVLIILNALLFAYAGYLTVSSIIDVVNDGKEKEEGNIITLLDKSVNKSLDLYNKYITSSVNIADIAIYGNYLVVSESRVTPSSFIDQGTATLFKVVDENPSFNEPNLVYSLNDKIESQIDLFSLEEGDYLIYHNFDITTPNIRNAYHYTGTEMFEETIYSLPQEDGSRTKITIKGKETSPALVVSVSDVSACPEEYYDFVILDDSSNEEKELSWIKELSKNYKIKEVNSLVEAYQVDASYALNVVDGQTIFTSKYLNEESKDNPIIDKGPLYGMDINNSIRELGGYLFNAGYGVSIEDSNESISSSSIAIKNNISSSQVGKLTIVVGNQIEDDIVLNKIINIIK